MFARKIAMRERPRSLRMCAHLIREQVTHHGEPTQIIGTTERTSDTGDSIHVTIQIVQTPTTCSLSSIFYFAIDIELCKLNAARAYGRLPIYLTAQIGRQHFHSGGINYRTVRYRRRNQFAPWPQTAAAYKSQH